MASNQLVMEIPSLEEWDDCRAHFNHDWLRNRYAIALGKLANVLNGNVDDPGSLAEMRTLLQQWNERRAEAERLVSNTRQILSPSRFLAGRMFSDLDVATKKFFAEVADAAWRESEQVEARISNTEFALRDLNELCLRMVDSLPTGQAPVTTGGKALQELVQQVRHAVSCLATAISELGRCRHF